MISSLIWNTITAGVGAATGGALVIRHLRAEIDRIRMATYDLNTLLRDQVGDLERALQDVGIAIPHGVAQREREARIAEGRKLLGLNDD